MIEKYGVFGYTIEDVNVVCLHYDNLNAAQAGYVEYITELNGKDLAYIELWQADDGGLFGVSGEPIQKQEFV